VTKRKEGKEKEEKGRREGIKEGGSTKLRNCGIISFAIKWMELEVIMLRMISQVQNARYHMLSLICGT
jgi:hypothetical protein